MSIFGAILAFALILLLTPGIEYLQVNEQVFLMEENIQNSLKDVCASNTILNYNGLKFENGVAITVENEQTYIDALFDSLGYRKTDADRWEKDGVAISEATLSFDESQYAFVLAYTSDVPVKILNKPVSTVRLEKTVRVYANIEED